MTTPRLVTAWCERAVGPGWTNDLVWVVEADEAGHLSQRALQPYEQSPEVKLLFPVCEEAHKTLVRAVLKETK